MNSSFYTTVSMANALWPAVNDYLGYEIPWRPTPGHELQQLIHNVKVVSLAAAKRLRNKKLIYSVAANNVAEVNAAMREAGFEVRLDDMGSGDGMLYVASIMKLLGAFRVKGVKGYSLPEINKTAFRLPKNAVRHYAYGHLRIIEIPSSSSYSMFMTGGLSDPLGWDGLERWGQALYHKKLISANGLVAPFIKNVPETRTDVDDLVGMRGGAWRLLQALMASKFGLSETGWLFENVFAFSAAKGGIEYIEEMEPEPGDYIADHDWHFCIVDGSEPTFPLVWGHVPTSEM